MFGLTDFQYRRTVLYKGSSLLHYIEVFSTSLFNFLLLSLKSSWETVRLDALEILQGFPDNYHLITTDYLHQFLIPSALDLTKNPVIRNAEGGALLLAFIIRKFSSKIDFSRFENFKSEQYTGKPILPEILFSHYVLDILVVRFKEMQQHLLEDQSKFAANLIHGLITTLSIILQHLPKSKHLNEDKYKDSFREFFHRLAETIVDILSYATKLSADNISTCILDNDITLKKVYELHGNF